jgi:hypothetical protein
MTKKERGTYKWKTSNRSIIEDGYSEGGEWEKIR